MTDMNQRVEAVRKFNRIYTKQIGILAEQYLKSPFSLTEARVIYELAHLEQTTATEIINELGIDAGQLSRILRSFENRRLIDRHPSETDGRQSILRLAKKGQEAFSMLNARSHNGIESMLNTMPAEDQNRIVEAMQTIEKIFDTPSERKSPYILRLHQPGDMGWVVNRHGVLYTEEYGWDEQFEGFVADIVSKFIRDYNPKRERCWIAEKDGENIGSVFLVQSSDTVAKLRMLIVDPKARGLGVGSRLVDECIRFARRIGYEKIVLWTNSILTAARHIYEKYEFQLVESEPHHSFGKDLIGETWELTL